MCVDVTRVMPWNARGWRQHRATSGGPLFEVNVHELDFMRHLCGEVEQVSAYGGNLVRHDLDFPDIWLANLRFRSGAVARLRGGVAPRSYYGGEVVFESNVSATFEWGKLTLYRAGADPEALDAKEWTRPSGLQCELGSFTRWVLFGEAPVLTAADGRAAVEMAVAVDRSIEESRPVDLPLG
jgi:predicted dehydrogenase